MNIKILLTYLSKISLIYFVHWSLSKSRENREPRFSDVFRGYRKRPVRWNSLILSSSVIRQKLNLKIGVARKQSASNCPKNECFLPPDVLIVVYAPRVYLIEVNIKLAFTCFSLWTNYYFERSTLVVQRPIKSLSYVIILWPKIRFFAIFSSLVR